MLQADWVGRVKLKLIVRDFSDLQPQEGHHDSCDLIWKIAFTFVEKIGGDYLKQIVHKASELIFYRNENWHKT